MKIGKPKLLTSMKGYGKEQLIKDTFAGMMVAVIAFPLSIALAISSGVSPERGLYSAIIGGFFVSLLGGSRVNIGGVTAATVMTVFTVVERFELTGLAVAGIMAGIILVLMGLLRLGTLLKYIPRTITLGFTAGIAAGIFAGQLKGFFGFTVAELPVKTVDKLIAYAKVLNTAEPMTLAVGLLSILILVFLPKATQKIPGSLAAIVIPTILVQIAKLPVATIRSVYGELPTHFPQPQLPRISPETVPALLPYAFTLAILTAIVSLLSCVVTDGLTGERHDSNQELIAEGAANIFCGLFGAVPVAGAVARSCNNVKYGGKTPVAGIIHSLTVALILIFLIPLAGFIPIAALSAVLIMVAYHMISWREIGRIVRCAPKSDCIVLLGTFAAGVTADLLFAVEAGIILSAVLMMRKMSNVTTIREWSYHQDGYLRVPADTQVFELDGSLFFATADEMMRIVPGESTRVIIFRMGSMAVIDITAIDHLQRLAERLERRGITLLLSHIREYPYLVMEKAGFIDHIGAGCLCASINEALIKADQIISAESENLPAAEL